MRRRDVMAAGLATLLSRAGGAQRPAAAQDLVYIGTQGSDILLARFDPLGGRVEPVGPVAAVERPTWLAVDPDRPILYAVSEIGNDGRSQGRVRSFAIDPAGGALHPIGDVTSGGGGPTHLSYDRRARSLFVANYGTGSVATIPVAPDGTLAAPRAVARDNAAQGTEAHAHAALLDPGGRFVVSADKGADRLFIRRHDRASGALTPADPPFEPVTSGSGPRHLAFSPDGRILYLVTESAADVRVFRWNGRTGRLAALQTLAIDPPGLAVPRSAAEIAVSADGRFVYASSRAGNAVAVFAANRATGLLAKVQDQPSQGLWPRSFAIHRSGRWMLVANQNSGTVAVLAVDPASGRLSPAGTPVALPQKPVAFAIHPRD